MKFAKITFRIAAIWGVLDSDDVLWILGERYLKETPLHEHRDALKALGSVMWYADPAGRTETEELRSAGVTVRKGDNEICAGIGLTMNMAARSIDDMVVGDRNAGTHFGRIVEVEPRAGNADAVRALRRDMSPRVDDHRMTPAGFGAAGVRAGLRRGKEPGLRLGSARSCEQFPVVLPSHQCEGRR